MTGTISATKILESAADPETGALKVNITAISVSPEDLAAYDDGSGNLKMAVEGPLDEGGSVKVAVLGPLSEGGGVLSAINEPVDENGTVKVIALNGDAIARGTVHADTASDTGDIATTTNFGAARRVTSVTAHFDAPTTGVLTITLVSDAGSAYNTVLATLTMTVANDVLWQPDADLVLPTDDNIRVETTGIDGGTTYGLRIVSEDW